MPRKILKRTLFGDPILRVVAPRLSKSDILSEDTQTLIADMRYTSEKKKYGVGLAAPQVGRSVALALIAIKPTPTRPDRERFEQVIINPEIVKTYGRRTGLWEGCISYGSTDNFPYGKALRYRKVRVKFYDEHAKVHERDIEGFVAHVIQHEIDHLNGVLFVDRVQDRTTFVMASEYRKRILPTLPKED